MLIDPLGPVCAYSFLRFRILNLVWKEFIGDPECYSALGLKGADLTPRATCHIEATLPVRCFRLFPYLSLAKSRRITAPETSAQKFFLTG